ncbi:MAG: hypothetical protein VZR24_00100 [Butyrivibrio hungatei]|nr:hypothetical protein [Butyrivibrio hungatei]
MKFKKDSKNRVSKYDATDYIKIFQQLPYAYQQLLHNIMMSMRLDYKDFDKHLIYKFIKHRIFQKNYSILSFSNELGEEISNERMDLDYDEYVKDPADAIRSALYKETNIGGQYYNRILDKLGITDTDINNLFTLEFATDTHRAYFFEALSEHDKEIVMIIATELLRQHLCPERYEYHIESDPEYNPEYEPMSIPPHKSKHKIKKEKKEDH